MAAVVTYHLEPGYIYVCDTGAVIRTVVGSCVAVSLWDRKRGCGGMNHFLYPVVESGARPTARYGEVAVVKLIAMLRELGSRPGDLVAQLYGGARQFKSTHSVVGARNIETARAVLSARKIRVVSEDVGGTMGRKVIFDTRTGQAAVLKVHALRSSDWH